VEVDKLVGIGGGNVGGQAEFVIKECGVRDHKKKRSSKSKLKGE